MSNISEAIFCLWPRKFLCQKTFFFQVSTVESLKSASFDEGMEFNMFLQLNYAGPSLLFFKENQWGSCVLSASRTVIKATNKNPRYS